MSDVEIPAELVERIERSAIPGHYTLGELISRLDRAADELGADTVIPVGFGHPHSWRGIYAELAFEVRLDVTVGAMLIDARNALGSTYQGWKGGDYTMNDYTDVWLVREEGSSAAETMGVMLLDRLLAAAVTT